LRNGSKEIKSRSLRPCYPLTIFWADAKKELTVRQEVETAGEFATRLGTELIGRHILTVPFGGYWPGGFAQVIQLKPSKFPEIVFQIKSDLHGEAGVLTHEQVKLLPKDRSSA